MIPKNDYYGLIYSAINKINGKRYVGQTTQELKVRIQNHRARAANPHLAAAFAKYGHENFEWEVLEKAADQKELDRLEKHYIFAFGTMDRHKGYNLKEGGGAGRMSEEVRRKIAASKLGKPLSIKHREKLSSLKKGQWGGTDNPRYGRGNEVQGSGNPMYGKSHSNSSRQAMSKSLKGRKGFFGKENPMCGKSVPKAREVAVFINEEKAGEFESIASAARFLGRSTTVVRGYVNGQRRPPRGVRLECL